VKNCKLDFQGDYAVLGQYIQVRKIHHLLWVHGKSAVKTQIGQYLYKLSERLHIEVESFTEFAPNPEYESIVAGVELFKGMHGDGIIATGGGSAIDVAKCIKLFSVLDSSKNYLQQDLRPVDTPLIAIPTTAGTGSEVTHFAVIYYHGKKCSVTSQDILPDAYLLDSSALAFLPEYQRKVTMLDAFCHAVEAYWSIKATVDSRKLSLQAVESLLRYAPLYLRNNMDGNEAMLRVANLAGKIIDITQTTAGHAMSYALTKSYGIAHGHAAALCTAVLWQQLEQKGVLTDKLNELSGLVASYMGVACAEGFKKFVDVLHLPRFQGSEADIPLLASSVNPVRLQNHPIRITYEEFCQLYREIIGRNKDEG